MKSSNTFIGFVLLIVSIFLLSACITLPDDIAEEFKPSKAGETNHYENAEPKANN